MALSTTTYIINQIASTYRSIAGKFVYLSMQTERELKSGFVASNVWTIANKLWDETRGKKVDSEGKPHGPFNYTSTVFDIMRDFIEVKVYPMPFTIESA